jgi:hypothetical protein
MPFLLLFFLLHLWTLCPEVSCYYFYYLRKYNDNPHKNNNTTNQTSNDTIQCQYSHTSCNSKILRHKKHTHFSDTVGASYQNPIKEIIKPICFIANWITGNHPQNKNTYRNNYFKALCYCLGINDDTRRNANRIYDFKTGCVKTECLHEGWQTSGSVKVVRMAFNLYCNATPSVDDYTDAEEQINECRQYTVEELFCCAYAPYFWQAIQIRYPEYATYNRKLYALFGGAD